MATDQLNLLPENDAPAVDGHTGRKAKAKTPAYEPPNLGKAMRLPVPDFNDPNRPLTCLEVDFPIARINALSTVEVASGPARKRVYCMSKWWARRASSVFRQLLVAAATEAPKDRNQAAKLVWDHYYANHQKAGSFRKLRLLDPFMGGGTTLVEGSRLGFQVTGVDLNPIAWFVTRNELACSDPTLVKSLFDHIEAEVRPLVQPFYTTTCPRGHKGRWVDTQNNEEVSFDPIDLPPTERKRYRWDGPEVIYTFWAKHGPCQADGCHHRTPIFKDPIIAQKNLSTSYIEILCPSCRQRFNAELGETRMAPGVERIVLPSEPVFTETSQPFANLLKDYDKGTVDERHARIAMLQDMVGSEPGMSCPHCGQYAGMQVEEILNRHIGFKKTANIKKKEFEINRRAVPTYLLIHPKWLAGVPGQDEKGRELGGYAGATPEQSSAWSRSRLTNLAFLEVRGESLPEELTLADGTRIVTGSGTVPKRSHFRCSSCGRQQDILESVRPTERTAPAAVYALQCYCPHCKREGFNYDGRFFKSADPYDVERMDRAVKEWHDRSSADLSAFWPRSELLYAYMTHRLNGGIPNWGYTHWWKMFNARQLLLHSQLIGAITNASPEKWPLDVREQVLGAWQEYSRHQCMFSFWDIQQDCLAPALANANFHPKSQVVENNMWMDIGRANWRSCAEGVLEGMEWVRDPSEPVLNPSDKGTSTLKVKTGDPLGMGATQLLCSSSSDLSVIEAQSVDLVITDPPFGKNVYYADLSDFFYVWLRIPLLKWYEGLPEQEYFRPERTPHANEAIDNPAEHPDDREPWEKVEFLTSRDMLLKAKHLTGDESLIENAHNPLFRPIPAADFYKQSLTACWRESNRLLKPGGLMAFTFHHSDYGAWASILESLFDAGFILVATFPVHSDHSKGENAQFGSKRIEYDIIHVCRKRLDSPQPASWSSMRKWVKEETAQFKNLIEHTHGNDLPQSDLVEILRGKALEFYSRHYGQVFTGDGQLLSVTEALLGINLLLDDLLAGTGEGAKLRPPEAAEPASRLFLQIFRDRDSIGRDDLTKIMRGSGVAEADFESRGWIKAVGTTINVVPIAERFQFFMAPGRNRKIIKSDLDQAHFLIGAATVGSGVDLNAELDRETLKIKRSADAVLAWYSETAPDQAIRQAASLAGGFVTRWRARPKPKAAEQMTLFEQLEAQEA